MKPQPTFDLYDGASKPVDPMFLVERLGCSMFKALEIIYVMNAHEALVAELKTIVENGRGLGSVQRERIKQALARAEGKE